jgi:hypothetical protein
MTFALKDWKDLPDQSTPISRASLRDLEQRLSTYTDTQVALVPVGPPGPAGLPPNWKSVKGDFGAAGDGTTDDTAAIQAGLDYVKANGTVLYFPSGTYVVSSQLNMDNSGGWHLLGSTPCMEHLLGRSRLKFTGTGSGSCLKVTRSFDFVIENLAFDYTSDAFTGHLLNIDGTLADCQDWVIKSCGSNKNTGLNSATSALRLYKAIRGKVDFCHFTHAKQGIRLSDPGGSYVNVVTIANCPFDHYDDCAIFIGSADLEKVVIRDSSFEAGCIIRGSEFIQGDSGDNACYNLTIQDNWFGDSVGDTRWIKGVHSISNANPCTIQGNQFWDTTGPHMTIGGKWNIIGNAFYSGQAFDNTNYTPEVLVMGNWFNTLTSIWTGADGGGTFLANRGASDRFGGDTQFVPANNASVTVPSAFGKGLVLSAQDQGGYISGLGDRGALYYGKVPLPGSSPMVVLQAPYSNTNIGAVRIVTGTGATPNVVVEAAEGPRLGFFAATPVTQPGRAGQLTDSTGGAVTSTLAAGITDAVAKNAIASLAAKVNALENIVHNLGLSA